MTYPTRKEVEEEFDKAPITHFSINENSVFDGIVWVSSKDVLAFIHSLLSSDRLATLEEVEERVKGMIGNKPYNVPMMNEGYDEALSDIFNFIQELKKQV